MQGKILLTGSNGQIGSELTDALVKRKGADRIIASDIVPVRRSDCETVLLDVTDMESVERSMKQNNVDTVFHLAAILSARGEKSPGLAFNVNVIGMRNVLEASLKAGVEKVFFPSTIGIFGPDTPKDNVPIETVTRPATMYGITKLLCEQLGGYYFRRFGLDVRGMRLPGIISYKTPPGGGTTDYSIEMLVAAALGKEYCCFLRKDTRLPMMYMPDAIESIVKLMEAPSDSLKHRTDFNVTGFSMDPEELEHEIRRRVPDFTVTYTPDERQEIADSWPRSLDSRAAADEWGFAPRYTLGGMVDDMLDHLMSERLGGQGIYSKGTSKP